LGSINVSGLELSLLINLVWNNNNKNKNFIEDLYDNLFDETFEEVCKNIFSSVNELLFGNLPQFISQQVRDRLIYSNDKKNNEVILDKIDSFIDLIRIMNQYENSTKNNSTKIINNFINYGTKYILQKSVLKDYDYFPDFIITKKETELTIIHYSIKKIHNTNNQISYKIEFKNDALPFNLSGLIRDNFLFGEMEIEKELVDNDEINSFQEDLFNKWGFRSQIKLNDEESEKKIIPKLNIEINKLVS